ncbi:MAG: hypothetical protein ABIQ06_13595 [Caldimonas sp.]
MATVAEHEPARRRPAPARDDLSQCAMSRQVAPAIALEHEARGAVAFFLAERIDGRCRRKLRQIYLPELEWHWRLDALRSWHGPPAYD